MFNHTTHKLGKALLTSQENKISFWRQILQLLREKLDRKWLVIGCNILQKGVFNPIPEHSKIGLLPAKTDVASAQFRRSDWLAATGKRVLQSAS